jgi:mono/diheme cytochrome c family protein
MKSRLLVAIAFIGILLFVAACAPSSGADANNPGQVEEEHMDEHEHSPEDHMAAAHNVPDEAAAVPNPISASEDSIAAGGTLFATNCAVCHGDKGLGDGPTAEALEKKPANLTEAHVQELSDGSLFYIISHGKAETPMPAWENVLEEGDRWNVVNFLRTLVDEHEEDEHMEGDEHAEEEHMEDDEHVEGDEHAEEEHMEDEQHTEGDEHTEDEHSD